MSALKALFAGAAGAAGYSAYQNVEPGDISKGIWTILTKQGNPNQGEVDRLKDQLDSLQKFLLRSQERQSVHIVHTNQRSGWGYIIYPTAAAGVVLLYVRYVKGWKLSDLMYVTRSSLLNMKQSMQESMAKVQGQLQAAQDEIQRRFARVSAQQSELKQGQEATERKVDAVATDVRDVADRVGEVHDDVHRLHDGLDRATLGIEAANRSIYLLCGAVVEVAKKVGLQGQHTAALDSMVNTAHLPAASLAQPAALQGGTSRLMLPQGLQTVIEEMGDGPAAAALQPSSSRSASATPSASTSGSSSAARGGGGGWGGLSSWLPQRSSSARAIMMETPEDAAAAAVAAATGRPRAVGQQEGGEKQLQGHHFSLGLKSAISSPAL